jgi:hypothetical protein
LQSAQRLAAECASAIDELFIDGCHFGHVCVRWNRLTVRKAKSDWRVRILSQSRFKFGECHDAQV